MAETSAEVIRRYVADAVAAEENFQAQYETFVKETSDDVLRETFHAHALRARVASEKLRSRLEALGGDPARHRGFIGQLFTPRLKTSHIASERPVFTGQSLAVAFALHNSAIAMYETLAAVAEAAGDGETGDLVRALQKQEKLAAEEIWQLLPRAAEFSATAIS